MSKIPVVRVGKGGATGTPDEFESHYTRMRRKGSGRTVPAPQPKLKPVENKSMEDRLAEFGLEPS